MRSHFVLGAGKMTQAIFIGLSQKIDGRSFTFYTPSMTSAKDLASQTNGNFSKDIPDHIEADFLWLGLKPQGLESLRGLGEQISSKTIVISMLAAIDEKTQMDILGVKKLIRVMPNLPVKYNQGVTLIASESAPEALEEVCDLFNLVGEGHILSENDLEKLTLLTGSGPAFIYEFIKILSSHFDHANAEALVRSVLLGSAETVKNEDSSLQKLIDSVTSKGGVTIAVLNKWRENGLSDLVAAGIMSGKARSAELNQK